VFVVSFPIFVGTCEYFDLLKMDRRRNVMEYFSPRHPAAVQNFSLVFIFLRTNNIILGTRLTYKTSKLLIDNRFYATYDLGPPFSRTECRAAWVRESMNVFSADGRNAKNVFQHILLNNGMKPDNFINILLHKIQTQQFVNNFLIPVQMESVEPLFPNLNDFC